MKEKKEIVCLTLMDVDNPYDRVDKEANWGGCWRSIKTEEGFDWLKNQI